MTRHAWFVLRISLFTLCYGYLNSNTLAVDIESFEFSDAAGTELANAVNTANPGNQWVEDAGMSPSRMAPSDVRDGAYNVVTMDTILVSNFLQIDNVTSGTSYLTATMSAWDLFTNEGAPNEQFRLAFLNDDGETFGNTITAQMQIGRNNEGDIELSGSALGAGASVVTSTALLPTTQSNPFQMTLELNKDSNTYKVFHKDGSNPTQVLGAGSVAPTRDGNSLRMAVNNVFGDGSFDYPVFVEEFFAVDRVALSDTNPHTDLITLDIDRQTGAITLRNTSGATIPDIESYSITSPGGGLDPAGWMSIGAGVDVSTHEQLSESLTPSLSMADSQSISLNVADTAAWLRSPIEDVQMVLNLAGGTTRTVDVDFIGNGDMRYTAGDLTFDNDITVADYLILNSNAETDLAGLSQVAAYRRGDLDFDGVNSILDFGMFKELFNAANGAGSFAAMLAAIPEPGSIALLVVAVGIVFGFGRNRAFVGPAVLGAALFVATGNSQAAVLEDFTFDDLNGTTLVDTFNSANPGNGWAEDTADMMNSAVLNGVFRVQKDNEAFGTNFLQIDNISSGKAWLVAEIAGWSFTPELGLGEAAEEIRFAFLNNDTGTSGSTITAQAQIQRGATGFELIGNSGSATDNVDDIGNVQPLSRVQTDPFTLVVELDEDAEMYSVFYRDGDAAFNMLGSSTHTDTRDGNSIRFVANNHFGGEGEFFDIDRIYLTDTSPLDVVETTTLDLEVNTTVGAISIANNTESSIRFDSYRIGSEMMSLEFDNWNSLRQQGRDVVDDGADPGETWDEAAGANDSVLAESFLLGSSLLAPGESFSLGNVFKTAAAEDLTFLYRDADTGAVINVLPMYVMGGGLTGDYNGDGAVNAADYVVWRDGLGEDASMALSAGTRDPLNSGPVNQDDYDTWKINYGAALLGTASTATAIPEPASLVTIMCVVVTTSLRRTPRHATPVTR